MPPTKPARLSAVDRENMSLEEQKQVEAELAARPVYKPIPCSTKMEPAQVTVVSGSNQFEFKLAPK
jgi:hypothetical protein